MRWSLRYQLLVPLLILLLGVVGLSTWTALASAARARRQIEAQLRQAAHTLSELRIPLTRPVLGWVRGLSGADFLVLAPDGWPTAATFAGDPSLPADAPVADGWENFRLGPPVEVGD